MRFLPLVSATVLIAACSGEPANTDRLMDDLDCLSAITVVEITDAIRDGLETGMDAAELTDIAPTRTAAAAERFIAKYGAAAEAGVLEADINGRLERFQNAMSNRDPDSIDTLAMETTIELGRSCSFED